MTDQEMPGQQSGIAEKLSEQEGRLFYRQTAGSWNILDTLAYIIIWNHWSATRRFHNILQDSMKF
jgi:hypothetical protein